MRASRGCLWGVGGVRSASLSLCHHPTPPPHSTNLLFSVPQPAPLSQGPCACFNAVITVSRCSIIFEQRVLRVTKPGPFPLLQTRAWVKVKMSLLPASTGCQADLLQTVLGSQTLQLGFGTLVAPKCPLTLNTTPLLSRPGPWSLFLPCPSPSRLPCLPYSEPTPTPRTPGTPLSTLFLP